MKNTFFITALMFLISIQSFAAPLEKKVTVTGAIFTLDTSVPELGEAYKDPSGVIWGAFVNQYYQPQWANWYQAEAICRKKFARLPEESEVDQLHKYLGEGSSSGYYPYLVDTKIPFFRGMNSGLEIWTKTVGSWGCGAGMEGRVNCSHVTFNGKTKNQVYPYSSYNVVCVAADCPIGSQLDISFVMEKGIFNIKFSRGDKDAFEIVDASGYVSAYLAQLYLRSYKLSPNQKLSIINFIKNRLNKTLSILQIVASMKATVYENGYITLNDQEYMQEKAEFVRDARTRFNQFVSGLNAQGFTDKNDEDWMSIVQLRNSDKGKKLWVTDVPYRKSGENGFSDWKILPRFDLDTLAGVGIVLPKTDTAQTCSLKIGKFEIDKSLK